MVEFLKLRLVLNTHNLKSPKEIQSSFTLKDIEHIFLLEKHEDVNCGNVAKVVDSRLKTIAQKIAELQQLQSKLIQVKESCSGNCNVTLEA